MSTKKSTGKKKTSSTNKLKKMQEDLKETNDKLLRVHADFQNYQKRMEKELNLLREETKKTYICELIDLYDLLKKAYKDNDPKKGLELLLNNIEKFFDKENIKIIECVGNRFDHNLHHAVTTVEQEDCDDDIIVEEVKRGYMVNDKVIRPSQVIVNKNKES
jgi:molecular chaperone GrpE